MSRSQREYVLRQQMRNIQEELGEAADDDEVEELRERIARAELPLEAEKIARKQLGRLSGMQPQSAEYKVTSTYLEWLADLPWSSTTPDRLDVRDVRRCLDEDHFGLDQVKKRIVEYSAIRQLRRDKKGPDSLLRRPAGRGQDLARQVDRARHGSALRSHLARRRPRRGRDPRPSSHVRRRAARVASSRL